MSENTARTVIVFSLIGIILLGFAIGGVRFIKARNQSLASVSHQAPAAQSETKSQTVPQQKSSDGTKKSDNSKPATNSPIAPTPSTQSQPAVPSQNSAATPQSTVAATGPQSVAATGPTDVLVSLVLLMLAVFFGGKLFRARADFRRYIRQF